MSLKYNFVKIGLFVYFFYYIDILKILLYMYMLNEDILFLVY